MTYNTNKTPDPELMRILNELEVYVKNMEVLTSPESAYALLREHLTDKEQEEFWVVTLTPAGSVIDLHHLYTGTKDTAHLNFAEIMRLAILDNAGSILLAHNHPSGIPDPSPEDIRVTEDLRKAGKMLDIHIMDHIIVGHNCFKSIRTIVPWTF